MSVTCSLQHLHCKRFFKNQKSSKCCFVSSWGRFMTVILLSTGHLLPNYTSSFFLEQNFLTGSEKPVDGSPWDYRQPGGDLPGREPRIIPANTMIRSYCDTGVQHRVWHWALLALVGAIKVFRGTQCRVSARSFSGRRWVVSRSCLFSVDSRYVINLSSALKINFFMTTSVYPNFPAAGRPWN